MAIEIVTYPRSITVEFEEGNATMEVTGEEGLLLKELLYSHDFWASFLGSLSAALGKHK